MTMREEQQLARDVNIARKASWTEVWAHRTLRTDADMGQNNMGKHV